MNNQSAKPATAAPREWTLHIEENDGEGSAYPIGIIDTGVSGGFNNVHVIEYSAFADVETQLACVLVNNGKLKTEVARLEDELAWARKILNRDYGSARAEIERLKDALVESDEMHQPKVILEAAATAAEYERDQALAEVASLKDQLQWSFKNETQYKDATGAALEEVARLRRGLEFIAEDDCKCAGLNSPESVYIYHCHSCTAKAALKNETT